ncbi:hypothetical protein Taro_013265 [Colocasia esculenta]|uniref:Omega-hydroxypalmitate O-feruloyl transferase n=1 Tax=Colocasia esculenta TaxID=4460 RepID=A0A843UI83_COLES|nr:hypothetical protein [Colocasia esculenta]
MGALCQAPPLLQDLRVTLLRSSIVRPPREPERRFMFLSNIDQFLDFNVDTVQFFHANSEFTPAAVAEKLETALGELLGPYDFLAGRLKWDNSEGRWGVDCNGAGVGFALAASEVTLAGLGDLEQPNPAFQQLVARRVDAMDPDDRPLFVLQVPKTKSLACVLKRCAGRVGVGPKTLVTSFICGGFAVGISNCHATFDGVSFRVFLENLAALAAGKPLAVQPCNDRRLLAARAPPQVAFPHPELLMLDARPPPLPSTITSTSVEKPAEEPLPTIIETGPENLEFKLFRLSSDQISTLKGRARADGAPAAAATSFNIVTAHLWRCKALAAANAPPDKPSMVLYAVDIRGRLRPPLPRSYTGNAVLSAYGVLTQRELGEKAFGRVVEVVREGSARMDDEYARSVVDWGQLHKGFPRGDVFISSWWRLGFDEVEFPWKRPLYCCPLALPRRDIIVLFPTVGGLEKGVNALVALPGEDMKRFEGLFYS